MSLLRIRKSSEEKERASGEEGFLMEEEKIEVDYLGVYYQSQCKMQNSNTLIRWDANIKKTPVTSSSNSFNISIPHSIGASSVFVTLENSTRMLL